MSVIKLLKKSLSLLVAICLLGCYPALRKEAQQPEEALQLVRFFYPEFHDDADMESLALAIQRDLEYLARLTPDKVFQYGPHTFTCEQIQNSLRFFLELIAKDLKPDQLDAAIREHFLVYRAAGRAGKKKVLFTGYFEPNYPASLAPDETYQYPLYAKPDDIIQIDLSLFSDKFEGERILARIQDKKVLPYYSREQIEKEKALAARNLELVWLKDPLDVTFLHIQGSGRLTLPNGERISVGYHASNGRPYKSIGKYLLEKGYMQKDQMSMQGIRQHLAENPAILDEVLHHNPSYVFFRILERGPLGNINVPLTPGRSVALDSRLFPKGALAFISCQKPVLNAKGELTAWKEFSRFVLNQDTGSAITGAGRADFFWGSGPFAEMAAGHMKHEGDLYVLIKKP